MSTKNVFHYPMDRGSIKRRTVVSGVALGLMVALTVVGFIGVKQGWLTMKPTRRGVSFSFARETEAASDDTDPTVVLDVITDETAGPQPAAKRCSACGEVVAPEAVACPNCGSAGDEFVLLVKCPACGELYDFDDPQCPSCAGRGK